MRALGEPSVRFGALSSGTVDATMITIGNARIAQAKGFRILPTAAITFVAQRQFRIQRRQDSEFAGRSLQSGQGDAQGSDLLSSHPSEAAKFIMEVLRITDHNEAKEIWRERDKQASDLAKIGRASEEVMTTNIERVRAQMQGVGAQRASKDRSRSIRFTISVSSKEPTTRFAPASGIRCATNTARRRCNHVSGRFRYLKAIEAASSEADRAIAPDGDDAKLLAGGQSLVPMMKLRVARPKYLIDIHRFGDLNYIREEAGSDSLRRHDAPHVRSRTHR